MFLYLNMLCFWLPESSSRYAGFAGRVVLLAARRVHDASLVVRQRTRIVTPGKKKKHKHISSIHRQKATKSDKKYLKQNNFSIK